MAGEPTKELIGIMTVRKVHHFSLHNGYGIVTGDTEESRKSGGITFKGTFAEYPEIGQVFCVKGTMEFDKKYDKNSFKMTYCRPQESKSEQGWIDYLIRECPRISEMRATELVDAFGIRVVEVMADPVDAIEQIMGVKSGLMKIAINLQEAHRIHEWAKKELRLSKMKAWLYERGLTYSLVARILAKHGTYAPTVVRNEPYSLTEIDGIGFLTADKIARAVKIPPEAPARIRAGILYQIKTQMEEGGHTCLLKHDLLESTRELLGIHHNLIQQQIDELLSSGKLCDDTSPILEHTRYPFLFEGPLLEDQIPLVEGIEE